MSHTPSHAPEYREYLAWDVPTRWFHWINALAVIGLIATGLVILNDDALGLSAGGKILVKSIHVSLGYVMAVNLLWRFIWAFFGNRYARWRSILPGGPGYLASLRA
jgi:Ni/Fe-hydrogenase 1 B-type cytochrome subunit